MQVLKLNSPGKFTGVYFLCYLGRIIYIGSSSNVFARILAHSDKKFDEVRVLWTSKSKMVSIEYELIEKHNPSLNNHIPKKSTSKNPVGRRIRKFRKEKGFTLPQLANKAGISQGNLSKIENHPCNISLETLHRLADAMNISLKDFLP